VRRTWVWISLAALQILLLACTTGSTQVEGGSPASALPAGGPVSTSVELGPDVTSIDAPRVAIDGDGGVHLIWWDNTIGEGVARHATVVGGSVGDPDVIGEGDLTGSATVLVRPTGEICAFFEGWLDEADLSSNGFYMRCLSGEIWSGPDLVTSVGITTNYDPAFDASGVVRVIATTPTSSVTYEGRELSEGDESTFPAQLAIDSDGAYHVVWQELADIFELNHRVSVDGGATWSPIESLEGTEFFVPNPTLIAASDGSIHVFYDTSVPFHRVWTSTGGWGEIEVGPTCGGDQAYALGPEDVPVTACANIGGVHLAMVANGAWTEFETLEGSTDAPAGPISIAVGPDGTRHLLWVASTDPPSLRYATVLS